NIATALSTIVVMAFIDVRLTIISLAIAPVFLLITRRVGAIRREISKLTQQSMANLTATTQETLSVSGVLLTKTFGRQSEAISRFSNENESLAALEIRQQMIGRWFFMIISVFFSITPAIVYLVAGRAIIGGGTDLTIGGIVAFTTLQSRLFMPLGQLLNVHVDVQGALALFDRIFEYLDMEHEITDRPGAITLEPATVRGDVVYDHVSFQYDVPIDTEDAETTDLANRLALDDININIKAGQLVALVGPSGAGKTTLTYLLPRLYDVTSGAIRIDGHDVRDIKLESLGEIIGFVTQETYLFHSSIRDNLAYGLPNATDAELKAAASAAAIHDRIAELPDGYDTIVGERGYKMSGGEKQRLALARVILKDPRILILDEATSALDTHSERVIQHSLETLMRDRTTIAIAHRLSTILAADQILVIDAGRVVESGTHSELIATSGLYASLYHEQFSNADRREHELATFS
ncbi:MAG: ABC transporter ATP-binding protein, partial [Chloroflexia bacterium]|nr:ABC transporter ATP-binding protein [Chloroflexia bacterium]